MPEAGVAELLIILAILAVIGLPIWLIVRFIQRKQE
jgi:flagellar biogenesis protein FliO